MLVSLKWLKTMVNMPKEADDIDYLCDRLDMTGTGVEGVNRIGASLDGVVVGQIVSKEHHPDADKLWVTAVDVGDKNVDETGNPQPLQIVCGAQNFEAGDKIALAMIGTVLPGDLKIKKSKLRGVTSYGMNCSAKELGISDDHEGIMILPKDAPVGMPICEYLNLSDTVLDLEITPNRPDCMSMLGMAREIGAIFDTNVTFEPPTLVEKGSKTASELVDVTIEDADRCPRYTARVIENVKIGPSPDWLVQRIVASGARSINNIVDVTNYILFELGQPLHAFDMGCFKQDENGKVHVVVRKAFDDEPFTTLDGNDRILTSDMTVIADGNSPCEHRNGLPESGTPVALAGVMGGLDSEVTDSTTTILLESATFGSGFTSRTSRNLQLFSESAARYERGVDAQTCDDFSAYAASLIAEVSGGKVCPGVVDIYPKPAEVHQNTLRADRLREFIGADIPDEVMVRILVKLGCKVEESGKEHTYVVTSPSYRPDLTREIDLYEEILRIWGTEKVDGTLPSSSGSAGGWTYDQQISNKIGLILRACGVNETLTYSFVSQDDIDRAKMERAIKGEPVVLINPLSSEMSVMRCTLIPGLLRSIAYNHSRGVNNVHLYECGAVFEGIEGKAQPDEPQKVSCVLTGSWNEQSWNDNSHAIDFYDAKGIIETLAHELAIPKLRFKAIDPENAQWLQPGCAAQVLSGKRVLGWVGTIHPLVCASFDIDSSVFAFELDEKALIETSTMSRPFKQIPQYPAVDMDLSVVLDDTIEASSVINVIQSAGGNMIESVTVFDVYKDEEKIGANKKSLAFSIIYRLPDKTLTFEEVEKRHRQVIEKVQKATGGAIRQ